MEARPVISRIFTAHEDAQLLSHLEQLETEYHKPHLRFNKPVKVPTTTRDRGTEKSIA